jgi:general secretion pathway protein I
MKNSKFKNNTPLSPPLIRGKLKGGILNFQRGGFTLLEIMISLAVIGGLLVTLMYTLNYNLGLVQRHETITIASLLAKEKIDESGSISEKIKGSFSEPYSDYSYEMEMNESPYPGVSEVSIVVKRDKEEVRFTKLIQGPNQVNR